MSSEAGRGPFKKMVVLGESTVQGGGWLRNDAERWSDILAALIESAQESPLGYLNAGLGASVISPASPGYDASAKPSAAERLDEQVIAPQPDLVVIAYGLNDMRAGMPVAAFLAELTAVLDRIEASLNATVVLVSVYYISDFGHFPPFNRGSAEATREYNAMLAELAAARGYLFADVHAAEDDCDHVVHQDTVHANKIGNLLIAHRAFEAVARGCPGIAAAARRRDETTEWTQLITPAMCEGREPSDASKPGQ